MSDQYESIVNISNEIISLIARDYSYEVVNDAYCQTIGKTRDQILGKHVAEVWGQEKFEGQLKKYLDRCFNGETIEYMEKFKFGLTIKHMYVSYRPHYSNNEITHVIVFSRDETKKKELEQKLHNYEYRDPTTGLFNRRSLETLLDKEINRSIRSKTDRNKALLFLSLEDFARINQLYGHHIGDVLIENSGIRIKSVLRDSDYIFRFEGKELAVLLTTFNQKTDVAKVANKIIADLAVPYRHRGGDIMINSHIGITMFPDDGDTSEELIKNASAAMQEAKIKDTKFVFFNSELQERAIERLHLESDLNQAFVNKEFELKYQPIVKPDGTICGAEALIRWYHEKRGIISPLDFIPLAEETGMIVAIGKWALYQVCERLKKWSEEYGIYVSVNLSAREFNNIDLMEIIEGALKAAGGINPKYLKLEITETQSMSNPHETIHKMKQITTRGIDILIDDFGTGQSSLQYLKQLPAQILKIDKIFIDEISTDDDELDYLSNIIGMGKSRKKIIICEGVATKAQADKLKQLNCDRMQGYYFSKPISAKEFEGLLAKKKPLPF